MHHAKAAYGLAKSSQWLVPIVVLAAWCFAAFLQQRGWEYAWVVFLQAGIGTLILAPFWVIARAQVKVHDLENRNGQEKNR